MGPAWLDVRLDQALAQYKSPPPLQSGTSALRVFWPRSRGHVDWYDLTLEDTSSGSSLSTRIMGTAATQSGFSALIAGTLYTLSLVATAGNKRAPPVRTTAATGEELLRESMSNTQKRCKAFIQFNFLSHYLSRKCQHIEVFS